MKRFFKAVREGDESEVMRLLDADPGLLEKATHKGNRPLALAAANRRLGLVKLLIGRGADVNATGASGMTALHGTAWGGDEETVAFLLKQGAHANSTTLNGLTPLRLAYHMGYVGVVRVLLQHMGTQVLEETDEEGWRALHSVAYNGHEAMATFLLEQGAQANSRGALGGTPLMLACLRGRLAVVGVLLRHVGLQALEEADEAGMTALHLAALAGHGDVVAFLMGQGADTRSRDTFKMIPLLCGCKEGHLGVARVLLEHMGGRALQETDAIGRTALHLAATGGHEEVAALLLSKGAQVNSRDIINKTPLKLACEKGHMGVLRILAQHMGEAGLKEKDANGRTVLHWAVEKGYHEAVRFLLLAGADPTITDNEGRTPRALAEGEVERAGCVAAFEWYECEVERRVLLYRATCLQKTFTTQRAMPSSQVPTYLAARLAAGHAVPRVVVSLQPVQRTTRSTVHQAATSGKRKAADEGGDLVGTGAGNSGETTVGEEERHVVLKYVVQALNEQLLKELLEGFPL